jgi:UDP-glucose 4-epimerase
MRIFMTGATGFLGSYLTAHLVRRGHAVAILMRQGSDPWRIAEVLPEITILYGSLDALHDLRERLVEFRPEAVVHLAWRGVYNFDRNNPLQARNIVDSVELTALSAELGAAVFVGAGSQAEYGPYARPIREDDVAHPTTLYGKAKLAAHDMSAQIAEQRGLRFVWLRIFSAYGPKDAPNWLIPKMITTLREGRRMALTRCEQLWGFLHARDAAAAFRIVLEDTTARGIYNVGSPQAPPLRETVLLLRELVNARAELGFGDVPYRPDQVMSLKADVQRLSAHGWSPEVPLETGLRETVQWYDAPERP